MRFWITVNFFFSFLKYNGTNEGVRKKGLERKQWDDEERLWSVRETGNLKKKKKTNFDECKVVIRSPNPFVCLKLF